MTQVYVIIDNKTIRLIRDIPMIRPSRLIRDRVDLNLRTHTRRSLPFFLSFFYQDRFDQFVAETTTTIYIRA